jgi:hypothetical protein
MIDIPPAAEIESVHPGKGSLSLEIIIDGLKISNGTFPRCFYKFLSDKLLV